MSRRYAAAALSVGLAAGASFTLTGSAHGASVTDSPHAGGVVVSGEFGEYAPHRRAVTYDRTLVPTDSRAWVFAMTLPGGATTVALTVHGMVPEREYGAHVHTRPCGPTGEAAGPHTQNVQAPPDASHDPAYANPRNEVWLEFTTGPSGSGFALSKVEWPVGQHAANSVVIHERHTSTAPGTAGEAGDRLACINVNF